MIFLGLVVICLLHLVSPSPISPGGRIANFCSCNGQVNSKGEGECRSSYMGQPFCYIDPGVCKDGVKSETSEQWWSYQACDNKASVKCSCNEQVNSKGEGECRSSYMGRPFCYIDPGVCKDGLKSTTSERWWSYQACDNKASVKCSCNGQVNSKGEGECRSSYMGQLFCYINPGVCKDGVKSTTSERWWSYQACDSKASDKCSCNGQVNSKGLGECTSSYRGRPFCYIDRGVCKDGVKSTTSGGGWWSYQACDNNNNSPATTGEPNSQVLFPEQPVVCKCNGQLNDRGEGECSSSYQGRVFCYVEQGLCQDELASTADGWWSYLACQQEKNVAEMTVRPSIIEAPSPEQPQEQDIEDIFVEKNPRAALTAANYCPDQCTSTGCFSSQCALPTCQHEGKDFVVGDTFWANEADICSNRCECKAIFVSTDPLKVGGAVDCQALVSCNTCVHVGKNYTVGAFNDGCNECICDEFGGVTCKPAKGSDISPRNNPGCMQGNSDDPLICVHMGKRYAVGAFNDGCSNCICDEFGGVTCKPASGSGISRRNNPGCMQGNSDDPLVASVDLEVNSRIIDVSFGKNSRKKLEPKLQIKSNGNLIAGQIN